MAIGKVNAYATVDAPKADFGAVAQMNIDNLVKSVKEDEQAKAAKAAAAEKVKEERRKSRVDFPTFVPTGGVALDSYNYKEAKDSQEKYIEDVRLWEETGDTEAKTRADKAVAYQKNINAELTRFSDVVKNTGKLMGEDKVNSKQKEHIQEILNAQANGEFILRRDHNTGEVYGAVYKKTDDPSKMEFVKEVNMKDFYGDVSNPVPNIEISKEQEIDQNLFEKTLTETSLSALKETGIKALSPEALASLDKKASERMGDDNFMYVYASAKNIPLEGDKYKRTFTNEERKIASEMYAKELKSMFGKETIIERRLGHAPTGGRGGGDEDTFKPSFVSLTNADFFGNKDKEGQPIDNYARDAKSDVLTGISGTSPKSRKFIIPSFQIWRKGKPTNEKLTDFRVNRLIYDRAGRPTVEGDYIDTKSSVYKEAKNTALKAFMEENRANGVVETEKELNERADKELALNAETYGIERTNYVQQIGKVTEKDLATYMSGKKNRGVIIRDVPSMRRAMGYEPKRENKAKKYGI